MVTDMAAQALMDGVDFDPTEQTADQQLEQLIAQERAPRADADGKWSATCSTKVQVSRTASPKLEVHEIHTSDDETTPRKAIQDYQMVTP